MWILFSVSEKFLKIFYQLFWNTSDRSCFKNFSNHFFERKLLLLLIETESVVSKHLNLFQINAENYSQVEIFSNKITQAITANRLIDHSIDQIPSNQSMITEKRSAQKSKQKTTTNFKSQLQKASVIPIPNLKKNETTENISPTEVTWNSNLTNSTLIPGISITMHVPTKTTCCNSDTDNEPRTFEKFNSQD